MIDKFKVEEVFLHHFRRRPRWIVRAPGRVNLIGEHTDYNDGFVMPLAIDRAVWIGLAPRNDRLVRVHSIDYSDEQTFSLDDLKASKCSTADSPQWIEYLKGVAWSLLEEGESLTGWEGVLLGDVPAGAGLSSSAALEVATARAFSVASGFSWNAPHMAVLCQRAENRWVGVNCGIMDQMISACGRRDHAVLIDCRSLTLSYAPLPTGFAVAILDTGTRRGLVDSQYNARRADCEKACRVLGVNALRDATIELLESHRDTIPPIVFRRARHVISENERTLRAAEAMRSDQSDILGQLLNESHISLRDDYEVSSPALDAMVEAAQKHPACLGARMTGAGFGGCAVAIVRSEDADSFAQEVAADYRHRTGLNAAVHICLASDGAELYSE